MYASVQSHRDDDVRPADAQRFVALVEGLVARGGTPRLDRIDGPDRTGTARAVVDPVGRFVDIGLSPDWWLALGPGRVATGLIEALECARLKAALVPLIMRRSDSRPANFLETARGRIGRQRLIDDAPPDRIVAGPRGLFRLHVCGTWIDHAEADEQILGPDLTEHLIADARHALTELSRTAPSDLG